jgi:glutathione S-transferase
MKLYNADLSPFAARCRIQIFAKKLAVEIVDPPGGLHSPTYDAINPIGKVPCLDAGGLTLPESELICEYLEDKFPEPPLRPASPEDRARARLVSRLCDLYLMPPMGALFGQLNPKTRDQKVVDEKTAEAKKALGYLEHFVGEDGFALGGALSLADCTLIPMLFFIVTLGPAMGLGPAPLDAFPKLKKCWDRAGTDEVTKKVTAEMGAALAKMR